MSYARFYQQIAELPPSDKPDDETIQNDQKLDEWYERFAFESERKSMKMQQKMQAAVPEFRPEG